MTIAPDAIAAMNARITEAVAALKEERRSLLARIRDIDDAIESIERAARGDRGAVMAASGPISPTTKLGAVKISVRAHIGISNAGRYGDVDINTLTLADVFARLSMHALLRTNNVGRVTIREIVALAEAAGIEIAEMPAAGHASR